MYISISTTVAFVQDRLITVYLTTCFVIKIAVRNCASIILFYRKRIQVLMCFMKFASLVSKSCPNVFTSAFIVLKELIGFLFEYKGKAKRGSVTWK